MGDIERQRKRRQFFNLLTYALPLFFIVYGLKCVLTLQGMSMKPSEMVFGSFHLVPVRGLLSVVTGLAYIGFGVFIGLSVGDPPDRKHSRPRQIMRGVFRWGSLVAALWFAHETHRLMGLEPAPVSGIAISDKLKAYLAITLVFSFVLGLVGMIVIAAAMMGRKSVKLDLYAKELEPISIRWHPFAYWALIRSMAFEVTYLDKDGFTHRAHCSVSGRNVDRVTWLKDELEVIDV